MSQRKTQSFRTSKLFNRGRLEFMRMRHACTVLLAGAFFGGAAQAQTTQLDIALPHVAALLGTTKPLRIVAFGSSSTEGVGASSKALTYPSLLERDLENVLPRTASVEVVNRGIGGEDVDDMMARMEKDVIARKPDLVIWQTGSNDPLRDVPIDRFEKLTRAGIIELRAAGTDVVLMEPQWCPTLDNLRNPNLFRDSIRRVAEDMNVPVIRRSDLMHAWVEQGSISREHMIGPDGLHMTDAGYKLLADAVTSQILAEAAYKAPTNANSMAMMHHPAQPKPPVSP